MEDIFAQYGKRPTVATDIVIFTLREEKLCVLLIKRGREPFKGMWAVPGGFMEWDESCEESAARELEEETAVKDAPLQLLGVFSKPGRDPRGTIVSVAYFSFVDFDKVQPKGGDDAAEAIWMEVEKCPELAADHGEMLAAAKKLYAGKK